MDSPLLRIGTRGSPLAMAQTHEVRERLARARPELAANGAMEVCVIRTSGDKVTDRPLADIGGKGLFTKEIDEALMTGDIDIAVHSMKDVPTWPPPDLVIGCYLPREDPRDAFFSRHGESLADLPRGAHVGTVSQRRQAQILAQRPDLVIAPLRGNVGTRIRKLREGEVQATILALAGLRRLGLADEPTSILSTDEMLPAAGQAAIGIACRGDDARVRDLLAPLDDAKTRSCVEAERALLRVLDGSCRTPIAALAELRPHGKLHLQSLLATPDGSKLWRAERSGPVGEAELLGKDAGAELRCRAGTAFISLMS